MKKNSGDSQIIWNLVCDFVSAGGEGLGTIIPAAKTPVDERYPCMSVLEQDIDL